MASQLNSISVAQALGTTSALVSTGMILGYTIAVPSVLLAPKEIALKQWRNLYETGKNSMPYIQIITLASFGYCAYAERLRDRGLIYIAAGIASVSIAPFTFTVMGSSVRDLKEGRGDVPARMNAWATQNVFRAMLPFAAGMAGLWTIFT